MLNKVIIMGRLTRDPELRRTNSSTAVCSFSIACDRDVASKDSNERGTDFINVTAWKSTAEFVSKYFSKGRMVIVVGRLQCREYTDKDNNKRTAVEVVADSVYFGDSKKESESSGATPHPSDAHTAPKPVNVDAGEDDEGDLPF